jgi:hypothetical protein
MPVAPMGFLSSEDFPSLQPTRLSATPALLAVSRRPRSVWQSLTARELRRGFEGVSLGEIRSTKPMLLGSWQPILS